MRMFLVASLFASAIPALAATPDQIRQAAARAIALVQASQQEWDDGWSCASCHHQYLPAIAYQAARFQHIAVDEKIARTDAEMAFRGLSNLDAAVQGSRAIEPSIGDAYKLWAAEASGFRSNLAIQADVRLMAGRQKPDGHWATMDQRPPQSFSPFTATALAIRTITHYAHPAMASEIHQRVDRGRAWLLAHTPNDAEGRTFRLLGLSWSQAEASAIASASRSLLQTQQPDGGWNSIQGRASDAYSTGQALWALLETLRVSESDPSCQRALAFLLRTQEKDGSWHVATRLHPPAPLSPEYFESSYPYEHDQYVSIMGASWAVMALLRSVGAVNIYYRYVDKALPWAETALFGSLQDLRTLLDSGLDPNTATPEGTTALMMALPDLPRTKLLLDRGAQVNARARSNFSALDMAAQYRDSAPAIRLLLGRGAVVSAGADINTPHTMVLAASAGNVEALRLLKDAGASLDEPMIQGSVLYVTPLLIASMTGDADTVRSLLDLGADINKPDREGLTALTWATLANRVEVVRLLLERHADPNSVDQYGMTALLYAASVDYGNSNVLDLLLKHGARKDAKTKEGLTAFDRAIMFNHSRFFGFLREPK
jgi:ankyrin repeat protein